MIQSLRRQASIYGAIAAMVPKEYSAYSVWVWMQFIVQIISMMIFVYFWRAVYAGANTLGGLNLQQTINYILLAQILMPLVETRMIFQFGFMVRNGGVAVELLRPLDFQGRFYIENLAGLGVFAIEKLPLLLVAIIFFGLQLPADPLVWGVFAISLILGSTILFLFDWIFASLAFYSTETWGLSVVRVGVATFFSGALVPLTMMPTWLQNVAAALPFAQTIFVPVSFLSGITPIASAPQVWLVQLAWLVALLVLSRWVFSRAVRQVTVQGG
jgi:ABC-2 type transport system permease protein